MAESQVRNPGEAQIERSEPPPGSSVRANPAPGGSDGSVGSSTRTSARAEQTEGSSAPGITAPAPSVDRPAMPEPGDRIGEFEIREVIGTGGMGAVFRAFDTTLERTVALKILPPDQAGDIEVVQRFYQEARAAARLDHENIARVHSLGKDSGCHYIAFEFIDGVTIRSRVENQGPLSIDEAVNYTLQIAGALVHAAARGVVHRDIKPSNIVVTPQGRAKLVDMGLARRFERHRDDGLTQSGMTLGTFDYISPEQARDPRSVDVRSDLYSLGCSMFHMLCGEPPFPEGTVLQKLLLHQEEPPPDIRTRNPAIPADLAAIITKLMAKAPERRYQTPELLTRDLLALAGSLGLRSVSPEGLVWMSGSAVESPLRHLVWAIPAGLLCAAVGLLIYWSQEPAPVDTVLEREPAPTLSTTSVRTSAQPKPSEAPAAPPSAADKATAGTSGSNGAAIAEAGAGEIIVKSTDDLVKAIDSAPPRASIVLADAGPYLASPDRKSRDTDRGAAIRLIDRDLRITAARGVRPVIRAGRFSAAPGAGGKAKFEAAGLEVRGGRLVIEGVAFEIESADGGFPVSALLVDDADVTLRKCELRAAETSVRNGLSAGLRIIGKSAGAGARPAPIRLEASLIERLPSAIRAEGPIDLIAVDCTFAATRTAFLIENRWGAAPASLRLAHVSIPAGDGPVFKIRDAAATIRIDDSAVSPLGAEPVELVDIDAPHLLDWLGRANTYSRVRAFLQTADGGIDDVISRFAAWERDGATVRESGSSAIESRLWKARPARSGSSVDAISGYPIESLAGVAADVGARTGPAGAIVEPAPTNRSRSQTNESAGATPTQEPGSRTVKIAPKVEFPPPVESAPQRAAEPVTQDQETAIASAAPMPLSGANRSGSEGAAKPTGADEPATAKSEMTDPVEGRETPPPMPVSSGEPKPAGAGSESEPAAQRPAPPVPPADEPIRTPEQFAAAFRALGSRGGTLKIAAGAELDLPAYEIGAGARCRIVSDSGGDRRPKLRRRPGRGGDAAGLRPALFTLRPGASLQLEGVDVAVESDRSAVGSRQYGFILREGTYLDISGGELNLDATGDSALFLVRAGDEALDPPQGIDGGPEGLTARIRIEDSILRSGADLLDIASGRKAEVELSNTLAYLDGSLLHAHASSRDTAGAPVQLVLRQVTALTAGGLVALDSSAGRDEFPATDINVRDSILSAGRAETPLIRVNGQEPIEAARDPIRWEGHSVAYHLIKTYRRDSAARGGSAPKSYAQPEWENVVGQREDDALHGDLKFIHQWNIESPIRSMAVEDARLALDSPAEGIGVDLDRLPKSTIGK